jgi:hypothetical protein
MMMEGLIRSIKSATTAGELKGIKPFENCPTSTHQQFVDDTLLHGTPTVKEAKTYKRILEDFGEASGAEIDHSKSMIYFFNTNPAIQRNLANILGFERKTLPTKYLGIPLTDRACKMATWEGVINKLQEGKKLDLQSSQPGREAYPYQSSSTSNYGVYDVSVYNSQRSTTKDKSRSKRLPMARCRN